MLVVAKQAIPRGKRQEYKPYWNKGVEVYVFNLLVPAKRWSRITHQKTHKKHNRLKDAFNQLKTNESKKSWATKTSGLGIEKDSIKITPRRLISRASHPMQMIRPPGMLRRTPTAICLEALETVAACALNWCRHRGDKTSYLHV
ncbi:hypothetical protein ElyMa_003688800 [Elysia marginata]|uniref:Uncharacterized protein n=1 Tax=Elysia marginata TaxID=1093978 RepID=A0AAV4F2N5_9GAST|nr:hypothetical protein ElyMa_003688800 [Elysia marginata]